MISVRHAPGFSSETLALYKSLTYLLTYLLLPLQNSPYDRRLGPKVGGRLALFCIHRVNRVYGAVVVTSWTCYGAL